MRRRKVVPRLRDAQAARPAQHHLTSSLRPQTLLRSRRTSLQELCKQEDFLIKFNQNLIKTIKDMEDSSALKTRGMLQQQDIFGVRFHLGPAAPPLPSALRSRPPCRPPGRFGALSWCIGRLHRCCFLLEDTSVTHLSPPTRALESDLDWGAHPNVSTY